MRRAFLVAALSALVLAKPELYKEKEDFQYTRSSSDDGTKSGYYGAQRGNMGGNYEKAHNMDYLAQHHMGGLVRQVEGELGDATATKTGSVFTASNSRGIYGNGHYETSNLQGRNFQEGVTYGTDLQSLYDRSKSSALHNSDYTGSHSYDAQYQTAGRAGQRALNTNVNVGQDYGAADDYYGSGTSSHNSYQRSEYEKSSVNQHSSSSGSNLNGHLVAKTPVRVVLRPGTRVAVPITAQTYDASQSTFAHDRNAINSEAQVLSNSDHQTAYVPSSDSKNYESSYSYRKEWEKHGGIPSAAPLAIPTENPFARTSQLNSNALGEILSESQRRESGQISQSAHSSNVYSGHNANLKSSSRLSDYNSRLDSSAALNSHDFTNRALNSGANADLTNAQIGDSRPKSYSSSYAYHKSWERQGDPYVIKPVGVYDGQTSQRLTEGSVGQQEYSRQFGSQSKSHHQSYVHGSAIDCDCDENGHIRVARAVEQQPLNIYQQNENQYGQEELDQQVQRGWSNLEDLGQQTQNKWDNIEDLGQQTENKWDKLESAGQQTQNRWDKLEELGQQTQHRWDNLEDLGQQTQHTWNKSQDLGQQTQNKWDSLESLGQQTQNAWDKIENLGQQTQKDLDHITHDQTDDFGQQTYNNWGVNVKEHDQGASDKSSSQTDQNFNKYEQPHHVIEMQNNNIQKSKEIQNTWDKLNSLGTLHSTLSDKSVTEEHQFGTALTHKQTSVQAQNTWDKLDNSFNLQAHRDHKETQNSAVERTNKWEQDMQQEVQTTGQSTWNKLDSFNINEKLNKTHTVSNNVEQNIWDYLHKLEDQYKDNSNENVQTYSNGNGYIGVHFMNGQGQQNLQTNSQDVSIENLWKGLHNLEKEYSVSMNDNNQGINTKEGNLWEYIHKLEEQYKINSNEDMQTTYSNGNWHTNVYMGGDSNHDQHNSQSQETSLQTLWQKLHNIEKELSVSNNKNTFETNMNSNSNPHEYTGTQYQYQETHHFTSNTDANSGGSFQHNHVQTHVNGYDPHHIFTNGESNGFFTGTTSSVDNNDTSIITKATNSIDITVPANIGNTTRTVVTNFNATSKKEQEKDRGDISGEESTEESETQDIGRGDIGPGMLLASTTEKSHKIIDSSVNTYLPQDSNKLFKTPEQIEALSLSTVTNKSVSNSENKHEVNTNFENIEQLDSSLSVVGINQQKLVENERNHGDNIQTLSSPPPATVVTLTKHNYYGEVHDDSQSIVGLSKIHSDEIVKPHGQYSPNVAILPVHIPENKESPATPTSTLNTYSVGGLQETPVELEQNVMHKNSRYNHHMENNENLQSFSSQHQFNSNSNQEIQQTDLGNDNNQNQNVEAQISTSGKGMAQNEDQQFEHFDFGQQNENLEQQSQSQWEQNLDFDNEARRLSQSVWDQNENLEQQSQSQWEQNIGQESQNKWAENTNLEEQKQTENVDTFNNKDKEQTQDFYQQKYHSLSSAPIQNQPMETKDLPEKKVEVEVLTPPEVTTPKPGFWKSVGNKVSSAKDKVSSWFKWG